MPSARRRIAQAEAALLESHAILLKAFGPAGEALRRPVDSLVRLYETTGQAAKARKWRTAGGRE